ncbi:MAG: Ppx/GppA phosphatase family protein [Pseudomonadota bacterium]
MSAEQEQTPQLHADAESRYWVAIDLGSNSFHLLIVRPTQNSFAVLEQLKEKVQLLAGFQDQQLTAAAMQRGRQCLERFAQRIHKLPRQQISVMGTCALRLAQNAQDFCADAEDILGVPVEIIPGPREAALIYRAVAHQLPSEPEPRLVLDIGGGSTEMGFGQGPDARIELSLDLGCVQITDQHFAGERESTSAYGAAKRQALAVVRERLRTDPQLEEVAQTGRALRVFGTSGTIESIQMVLAFNGWPQDVITREGLEYLEEELTRNLWTVEGLPGLAPERVDIFPAGVAILSAVFEVLNLRRLQHVDVSLLHGMVCEALDTDERIDLRDASVADLAAQFGADVPHTQRVTRRVESLLAQVPDGWLAGGDKEFDERQVQDAKSLLRWASMLHTAGVRVNPRHYHRHGSYIIKHSRLQGFSRLQRDILALLVRGHRRSIPLLAFRAYNDALATSLIRLCSLLRLGVILERGHTADDSDIAIEVGSEAIHLRAPDGWLVQHPLSARELAVEVQQLEQAGIALTFE